MAKARIFISSTCYDLSPVREELDDYLTSLGFEVLNSQKPGFGVTPGMHSHSACLDQVREADYLLLIIGRRRGGTHIGSEKSITNEEFIEAKRIGVPIIGCVDKSIVNLLPTYKKNPSGDFSSTVDDKRVFHFIEYVNAGATDNWLHQYSNIADIKKAIIGQISHYLSLYSKGLKGSRIEAKKSRASKSDISRFPTSINDFVNEDQDHQTMIKNGLEDLYKVMVAILKSSMKHDNKLEQLKCLWVIANHGKLEDGRYFIDNDVFKQFAWSTTRGKRVFKQMEAFGVSGSYDHDEETMYIYLSFKNETEDSSLVWALEKYVHALKEKYGEDEGLEIFHQADMHIFS